MNVYQSDEIGCHIITATNDILRELEMAEKDLCEYSQDSVKMFVRTPRHRDLLYRKLRLDEMLRES
jgi:hypothetical protein